MDSGLFRTTPSGRAGLLFALFAFFVLPAVVGGQWLKIFTSTGCFVLAISGVAFMYARLGMVSLTQVGLMGVGGWVVLRLNHAFDLPFELNFLAAGVITSGFGMILALPALRLRGLYLALVTLMAAGGFEIIFGTFQFPNGGEGFWGVKSSFSAEFRRPAIAQSDEAYMRYTIFVCALGILLIEFHRRLAPGRAWALIKRSEAAAMSAGVNVTLYKTWAFGIAGLLAGISGALLAGSLGLLSGGTFGASESIMVFALAIVGGANFWLGAIVAATLFRILPALLNDWGLDADLSFVIFGAGLLHAVIYAPNGIAGQLMELGSVVGNKIEPVFGRLRIQNSAAKEKTELSASIEISDVSVHFGGVVALDNISASFTKQVSGIIGPNGAGKTTLMNVFSGFVSPEGGSVGIDGQILTELAPHKRGHWGLRRSFQFEEIADDLTVFDNVLAQLDGMGLNPSQNASDVAHALDIVGMSEHSWRPAVELNNFERRLTDVAKCLVGYPKVIMFDEPAAGLSSEETDKLGELILSIDKHTGAKTLVIDHDVDLIAKICEETLVLDFGERIAFGKTSEILSDPKVRAAYLGVEES